MKFKPTELAFMSVTAAVVIVINTLAANQPLTLPYTNAFEISDSTNYLDGYPIINDRGWGAAYDMTNAAVITNWADSYNQTAAFPFATHSSVLNVAGTVSNFFTADNTPDFVYIDVCIKPQLRDSPPTDQVTPAPQAAAYINSQSNLVFYYRWRDYNTYAEDYAPPQWATNTLVTISTSEWVRLTFEMAYKNYADDFFGAGYYGDCYYRIRINGSDNYFTNINSYAIQHTMWGFPWGNNGDAPMPRTWFMCANSAMDGFDGNGAPYRVLSSFTVSGSAQVDDLTISPNPLFLINDTSVVGSPVGTTNMVFTATLSGICPSDVSLDFKTVPGTAVELVDYIPTTGTVTIAAGQLSTSIVVVVNANTNNIQKTLQMQIRRQYCAGDVYTAAVIGAGIIEASTSYASYTSHGTPTLWLNSHGLSAGDYEVADTNDSDKDGMANWQEYWAGTIPTNSDSVLKVTSISGTTNYTLTWIGSTNDIIPPTPPWTIYRTTNMLGDPNITWTNLPPAVIARDTHILDSTHYRWTDPAGTSYGQRVFYKVTTTTNAP